MRFDDGRAILALTAALTTVAGGSGCASAPRCDVRLLYVTSSEYVWIQDDEEEVVARRTAVDRLVESAGKFERRSPTAGPMCIPNAFSPIRWNVAAADDDATKERTRRRALEVWSLARERGLELPEPEERFNYASRRAPGPPAIYRSRAELGDSASVVPDDFDFGEQWLVRATVPSSRMERVCEDALDAYMTEEPEERQADDRRAQEEIRREQRRLDGPAVRLVTPELRYTHQGELLALLPAPDREPEPIEPGECGLRPILDPVLVPIPHTRADWLVKTAEAD